MIGAGSVRSIFRDDCLWMERGLSSEDVGVSVRSVSGRVSSPQFKDPRDLI
jgi:hypothetical protein